MIDWEARNPTHPKYHARQLRYEVTRLRTKPVSHARFILGMLLRAHEESGGEALDPMLHQEIVDFFFRHELERPVITLSEDHILSRIRGANKRLTQKELQYKKQQQRNQLRRDQRAAERKLEKKAR